MSMMCYLRQLSPAQFAILAATPSAVGEFALVSQSSGMEQKLAAALAMLPAAERIDPRGGSRLRRPPPSQRRTTE